MSDSEKTGLAVISANRSFEGYTVDNPTLRKFMENKKFHEFILGDRGEIAYSLGTRKLPDAEVYVFRLHVEGEVQSVEDVEFEGKKMILFTEGGLVVPEDHRRFMRESQQNARKN